MGRIKLHNVYFALLVLLASSISAQRYTDSQQWMSAGVRYKPQKSIFLDLEQGWRLSQMAWTQQMYTQAELTYKFNKHFRASGAYRLSQDGSWFNSGRSSHRFSIDLSIRDKWGDFRPQFRTRFQSRNYDYLRSTETSGSVAKNVWRNKWELGYKVNKEFSPYISFELYTELNDPYLGVNNNEIRLEGGVQLDVGDHISLNPFYLYSREFNRNRPFTTNVLGLSFRFYLERSKEDE